MHSALATPVRLPPAIAPKAGNHGDRWYRSAINPDNRPAHIGDTAMDQPAAPASNSRNIKIILIIVAVLLLCMIGCAGGTVYFVFSMMKSSDAYKGAVLRARNDPAVQQALGEPIEEGFVVSGSINLQDNNGTAQFDISLSGPKSSGNLHVSATKTEGVWSYQKLSFTSPSAAKPIDLADPVPPGDGPEK
jgi:hypothetical protein